MAVSILTAGKCLPLVSLITFLISCSNKSTDRATFQTLDEGLVNSNQVIDHSSRQIYLSLQEKLTDPATVEKAKIWVPKADTIRKFSHDLENYIEVLKEKVKQGPNLEAKEANDLYSALINYKNNLMQLDSDMTAEFKSCLVLTNNPFDSGQINRKSFEKTFFDTVSSEATMSVLTKFQNNIKVNENKLLTFCLNRIPSFIDDENWIAVLVGQNTSYLKPGDKIEITAGVGSFTQRPRPKFVIAGKEIPIDGGVAIAKLKVSDKPGKHFIPVVVSYTDQDGKMETITKPVEYTVLGN